MPKFTLTDETVGALDAPGDFYDSSDGVPFSFGVRVGKRGKRWWTRYTLYGVRRRYFLGDFPRVKREEALWEAFDVHQKVRRGLDPQVERLSRRQAKTVEQVAEVYLKEAENELAPSTLELYQRQLRKDILPYWGKRSLESLKRSEIRSRLRAILARGAGAATVQVLAVVSNLFKLAEAEGWIEGNPCIGLPGVWKAKRRTDFFSPEEIGRIWNYLGAAMSIMTAPWKVLLLTGQRSGEIKKMTYDQLDGPWWELPHTKNGLSHLVYLSEPALEVVRSMKPTSDEPAQSEPVFPGRYPKQHFSHWDTFGHKAKKDLGIPHLRPHTARHTFITWLYSQNVEKHLIKALVNHIGSRDVTDGYNHYCYRPQRREWLTRYADFVLSCARGEYPEDLNLAMASTRNV